MLAVGYIRVSTDMQAIRGFSLDAQEEAINRYAMLHEMKLDKIYSDKGISGGTLDRPGLQEMLRELKPNSYILCHSLSRLSRSVSQFNDIYEKIKEARCHLVVFDLQIDTSTHQGKLMLHILSALAEFERDQLKSRISEVMQDMSRKGTLKKKPPYGYRCNKETGGMEEDEYEMSVVNKMKEMIDEDPTIPVSRIVTYLKKEGIKLRKSKNIYHTSVQNIINIHKMR